MTGSSLAAIVIPIAVSAGLAIWLILVFHAASHPQWGRSPASKPAGSRPAELADRRQAGPARAPQHRAA